MGNAPGRKIEFCQNTFDAITFHIEEGCSVLNACVDSGISESTYRRWKHRLEAEEEVSVAPEAKVKVNGSGLLHRLKAAERELKALKTGFKAMVKMRKDIEKIKGVLGC